MLKRYPTAMTDFWPYLRFRRHDVQERKKLYTQSFMAGAMRTFAGISSPETVISETLWSCLDDERELNIALRFLLTRFWFAISIGGIKADSWLRGTIIAAEEVVAGEIWSVSFLPFDQNGHRPAIFYILESTCEVIGHAPPPSHLQATENSCTVDKLTSTSLPLRADWSSYVHSALSRSGVETASVLSQLKWAHQEEYDRGISRVWLTRISNEGDAGVEKRRVAERYVLACVVANSVSGTWMSTLDMAQESAGLPNLLGSSASKAPRRESINLFLPAHHHIESVHFTTSAGIPIHPALAVIQTPGREYFILKDNGMEIGSEEDGVAAVWMKVLGCDSRGLLI
ncbi:hypothetical protein BDY19DRAFT_476849 [Irpex rosettiformis]|uniref:Uncharacterized protein n=1 Tax=Irpex rosettiformis TaxID=378272 RepID=A0ACB8TSG4_9APHY|nr:hypothetical protein BDY19DRAFT_476849 [Irpex rosettiformis]